MLKLTTKSGTVYTVQDSGIWKRKSAAGFEEAHRGEVCYYNPRSAPGSEGFLKEPEAGLCIYAYGFDGATWYSTPIVSIEVVE